MTGRHLRRRAWLVSQQELLARLPSDKEDPTDAHRLALREAVAAMRAVGLYSKHADEEAARWSIRGLVGEIRGGPPRDWNPWVTTTIKV